MLQVQRYLRSGKTLEDLKKEFSIKVFVDTEYPNLVCLKYDQINSPMHRKIVQQCRGLVLDTADNFNVVSRGFDKFFNYKEGDSYRHIDLDTVEIVEKCDGTLCVLYYYDGHWRVSTTGTSDASGPCLMLGEDLSYANLFWQVFETLGYQVPVADNTFAQNFCFFFELTTPFNRVVVDHREVDLTLIGGRHKLPHDAAQPEYHCETIKHLFPLTRWKIRKCFEFAFDPNDPASFWKGLEEFLVDNFKGTEFEGFVIQDSEFRRVKLKHPEYVFLHHSITQFSLRRAIDLLMINETEEVLAYRPEFEAVFRELQYTYTKIIELGLMYQEESAEQSSRRQRGLWWGTKKKTLNKDIVGYIKQCVFNLNKHPEKILQEIYGHNPTRIRRFFKSKLKTDNLFINMLLKQEESKENA